MIERRGRVRAAQGTIERKCRGGGHERAPWSRAGGSTGRPHRVAAETTVIGQHYGEWWNERPARSRARLAIVLVPLVLVSAWGIHAGLSGSGLTIRSPASDPARRQPARCAPFSPKAVRRRCSMPTAPPCCTGRREYGHRDLAMLLVNEGADVNAADREEITSLHRAAGEGDAEMVSQLLRKGADPGAVSRRPRRPAALGRAGAGSTGATRALLDAGAAGRPARRSVANAAVRGGAARASGGSRSSCAPAARTPTRGLREAGRCSLHWAAATRRRDVAVRMASLGADAGATDGKGNTALHHAALRGDTGLAEFLIEHGAAVDATTPELFVTPAALRGARGPRRDRAAAARQRRGPRCPQPVLRNAVALGGGPRAARDGGAADRARRPCRDARRPSPDPAGACAAARTRRDRGPSSQQSLRLSIGGNRRPVGSGDERRRLRRRTPAACCRATCTGRAGPFSTTTSKAISRSPSSGRLFSLPNSDYLGLGSCLVALYE